MAHQVNQLDDQAFVDVAVAGLRASTLSGPIRAGLSKGSVAIVHSLQQANERLR